MESVPKPAELLALHDVTDELFRTLRDWFAVPDTVGLDLADIDSAVAQLADPVAIAALAMRKLQALRLLAQPGVRTSTDVVVTIVQDLDRALVQAPTMRLHRAAAAADWDAELAQLLDGPAAPPPGPGAGTGPDAGSARTPGTDVPAPSGTEGPSDDVDATDGASEDDLDAATRRFRALHGRLHAAARAVVEASDGEVRYLV